MGRSVESTAGKRPHTPEAKEETDKHSQKLGAIRIGITKRKEGVAQRGIRSSIPTVLNHPHEGVRSGAGNE